MNCVVVGAVPAEILGNHAVLVNLAGQAARRDGPPGSEPFLEAKTGRRLDGHVCGKLREGENQN